MKLKALLFLLCIVSPFLTSAQTDELKVDENGRVYFEEVVDAETVTKNELYSRAKEWFFNTYKSAEDVLELEDKEAGKLIGKAFNTIPIKTAFGISNTRMWYTIKLYFKEGRYKMVLSEIYYQSEPSEQDLSPDKRICEDWLIKWMFKKNGKARKVAVEHKLKTINSANALFSRIKESLEKPLGVSAGSDDSSDW